MNRKTILTLFIFLLFSSCTPIYVYEPALYHQDIAYMPKPTSFDSVKTSNYVTAGLGTYSGSNYNDQVISGEFNLSRGQAFNNFNLAYGVFGAFGDYENGALQKNDPNFFTDKVFGDIGGRVSGNFFFNDGRADIRLIGFEAAYSHEFGPFANFRQSVQNLSNYIVDPRTNLLTLGLTTEVIFHNVDNDDFQHGIRGFLGTTLGHSPVDESYDGDTFNVRFGHYVFPKASYFIKFKNYFGTLEAGNAIYVRFGLKF